MTDVETRAPLAGLQHRFHRGLVLSLLNTLLSRVGMFTLGLVLARLLAPGEFGVYATALVVQMLLTTANEVGSAAAVMRHDGDVGPMLPTAWTLSLAWSALAFTAAQLLAPAIAAALGSPEATGLLRLMACSVLLDGLAAVPAAMLVRELLQTRRLIADVSGMGVNLLLTASLAFAGFGPWSLAIGNVGGTVLVVVLLIVLSGTYPRLGFDRGHSGEVIRCGAAMMGSSLLLVSLQGAPQLVTGSVLGATALGFFYIANNVANWPVSVVSNVLERIALPTFSRARDQGGDMSAALAGVVGLVGGAVLTCGTCLAVLAEPIVRLLYGQSWLPAVPALVGLAVATVARAVAELVFNLLVAMRAATTALIPQFVWLVTLLPATILAGHVWGLAGIGWAQAGVAVLIAVPVHLWCVHRAGLDVGMLARGCLVPVLVAIATAVALLALRAASPGPVFTLIGGATVTAGAVAAVVGLLRTRINEALASEAITGT